MLFENANRSTSKKKLPRYVKLLEQLQDSPLRALARTLKSWMGPIIAMWRFSKSNGITEGSTTRWK